MRRIAIINQKGGVGKTTTSANLGAALARLGRRVVVVDVDPQANLTLYLGSEPAAERASTYTILSGASSFAEALVPTATDNLSLVPSHIDLSGAELELVSAMGRETILKQSIDAWVEQALAERGGDPADYLIFDCAPSLGLLSINALAAADEVIITLQTEFFALQGMSKLIEILQLLERRLNPDLRITGILPCLYDSRLKLAREVLAEIRRYFPGQVFRTSIRSNVKLAESPSYGQTIFEYAPESNGAKDYMELATELVALEKRPQATDAERIDAAAAPAQEAGSRQVAGDDAGTGPGDVPGEGPGEGRGPEPQAAPDALAEVEVPRPAAAPSEATPSTEAAPAPPQPGSAPVESSGPGQVPAEGAAGN